MKIKYTYLFSISIALFVSGCSGNRENSTDTPQSPIITADDESVSAEQKKINETNGIGKFQNVELTHPLDQNMVKEGETVSNVKCLSCHKLSAERLVGPGWKGVTDRRTPEWIMNFITNVAEMLDKDANAQAMLEVCLVRMPNQNLTDDEARHVLEFMRKNDNKN